MKRQSFPGGWYADSLPGGEFAVLVGDTVVTHLGPLTPKEHGRPLFCRITDSGGFKIAGQSDNSFTTVEYRNGGWQTIRKVPCGTSPVIYDAAGTLIISSCGPVGAQGYRYVDPGTGRLVTGDASYKPTPTIDLFEWTFLGEGIYIGQGPQGGVWALIGGKYHQVASGRCRHIRASRAGDQVSIAFWVEQHQPSQIVWCTVAELRALPAKDSPRTTVPVDDEPVAVVPTFPSLPPMRIRTFGEPGYIDDIFPARDGMPALVFVDLDWDEVKKEARYALARLLDAEVCVYVDDAHFDPARVPVLEGLTVIPYQQAYPKREKPALTGRLHSVAERAAAIEASVKGLRKHHARVGMVLAYYRQIYGDLVRYNWPLQTVLDVQDASVHIAGIRGVTELALFHANRANGKDGIASRPELQLSAARLKASVQKPTQPPAPPDEPAPIPHPQPQPNPETPMPRSLGDRLKPFDYLQPFDVLTSANGRFTLTLQGDLNLVLVDTVANVSTWASHKAADRISMNGDGNLVGTLAGVWAWHSGTDGHKGAWLFLSDDGRVHIFTGGGTLLWSHDVGLHPLPEPAPIPTPGPVQWATGEKLTHVLANFCNLRDSGGRVVYTPALSAAREAGLFDEWMRLQREAGSTHVIIGPFEAGDVYPGTPFGNPDLKTDPSKLREFVLQILNTPSADGLGFRPVLFLDSGAPENPRARIDEHWPRMLEAIRDLLPYVIICPGWELIKASKWTSADMSYGLQLLGRLRRALAVRFLIYVHLSTGRGSFASHPPEPDDPWNGSENGCWKSHGGEEVDGLFAQLDPLRDGEDTNCDPADDRCYLNRWVDIVPRLGNGMNGWRVMPICLMEYAAFYYFRGQANEKTARDMATAAKRVADQFGVKVGFGNGLPW